MAFKMHGWFVVVLIPRIPLAQKLSRQKENFTGGGEVASEWDGHFLRLGVWRAMHMRFKSALPELAPQCASAAVTS